MRARLDAPFVQAGPQLARFFRQGRGQILFLARIVGQVIQLQVAVFELFEQFPISRADRARRRHSGPTDNQRHAEHYP